MEPGFSYGQFFYRQEAPPELNFNLMLPAGLVGLYFCNFVGVSSAYKDR